MAVYIGHDECQVIYVAKNGQQLRVSSIWVGDQQVFPPADRQETHFFTRSTQGYGRTDNGTHFAFTVPVPWWATSLDVVLLGAGEKGRDGTKSFTGGKDGAGGRSGAWAVRTVALPQSTEAVVRVGKGTSTAPHTTEIILPGVGGQADVRVHDGEGTRTANSGSTGGTPSPQSRTDYGDNHYGAAGGSRNNAGGHPGGGGGGGQGSNLIGTPQAGRDGGDGYVWLRFRSAPLLDPGQGGFILRVGVTSGWAYTPLREWAVGIGKTHETITEITVPMEVIGPSLYALFYDCHALTSIPDLDTSQVTDMYGMFAYCSSLTSIPALDTGQVTNMGSMFYSCQVLTTIPELDTGQVTNMRSMFQGCSALTTVPELDTSQVTDMYSLFAYCSLLTSVPDLDTGQVTNMEYMFYDCSSLVSVPDLDTIQVTGMGSMFEGCSSLTSVPALNASQVTSAGFMFSGCSSLESVTLPGMGESLASGQMLDMRSTKLSATAANDLMHSLGTFPTSGGYPPLLRFPTTATGANTSIATAKNWQVTFT